MSRPILPVQISPSPSNPSTQSDISTPRTNQTSGEQHKRQYTKRGAISKIACRSCRRRKTKCNSERPSCQNCTARSETCIYDYDESDRSLTFLRDNVENLAEERNALESVLLALQNDSEDAAVEIFRRLRSGTNLHTLSQQVHASRVLTEVGNSRSYTSPSSTLSRLDQYEQLTRALTTAAPSEVDEIIRRLRQKSDPGSVLTALRSKSLIRSMSAQSQEQGPNSTVATEWSGREPGFSLVRGTDSTTSRVKEIDDTSPYKSNLPPNQPWTTVTNDNEFIEHLFRLFFAWQHCFNQSFPEGLFRADYAAGRTTYCSSFLVNSICAVACLVSNRPEARANVNGVAGDHKTAGVDFYHAAVSQLDRDGVSSICTVTGLALLSYFEATHGRLSQSWLFCGRSGRMALDLNLHLQDGKPQDRSTLACLYTFWGSFVADQ